MVIGNEKSKRIGKMVGEVVNQSIHKLVLWGPINSIRRNLLFFFSFFRFNDILLFFET